MTFWRNEIQRPVVTFSRGAEKKIKEWWQRLHMGEQIYLH